MNGQAMGSPNSRLHGGARGGGDEAAFAQLVATYHADMARVAFVACGDRELAEDAVQSAWLVAWRKLHSLRDPDRVRPWLLAVTTNEARQLVRRRHGPVVEIDVTLPGDAREDPSTGIERVDLRRALATSRRTIVRSSPCATSSTSDRTSSGLPSAPRRPPPACASRGSSTASGRSSAMAERDPFELDLAAALSAYAEDAPTRSGLPSSPAGSPRPTLTADPGSAGGASDGRRRWPGSCCSPGCSSRSSSGAWRRGPGVRTRRS